jgi:hypothetical protein
MSQQRYSECEVLDRINSQQRTEEHRFWNIEELGFESVSDLESLEWIRNHVRLRVDGMFTSPEKCCTAKN